MRHKDVVYLITTTKTEDEIGNEVNTEEKRFVYANRFDINQAEFYNAAVAGMKPELQFEIYSFEYKGETKLEYENVVYNIIRNSTRGEKTRLVCEKVIGNG